MFRDGKKYFVTINSMERIAKKRRQNIFSSATTEYSLRNFCEKNN